LSWTDYSSKNHINLFAFEDIYCTLIIHQKNHINLFAFDEESAHNKYFTQTDLFSNENNLVQSFDEESAHNKYFTHTDL
jgi:hypothetical protein